MRVLVIQAHGLHLGYLGCYGNEWIGTPNLDRLAAEGVVFDQHYLEDPTSTSVIPEITRIAIDDIADFGQAASDALAKSDASVVWIDGPVLTPPWKLPEELQGAYFDEEDEGAAPWLDPVAEVVADLSIDELLELQNTYAAAVTWFDAQLGVLIDALRESGVLGKMLLCVTASAGLPLGEHGAIGAPRAWLYEELVHVPLILRFPDGEHAGACIGALTQPADLLPTIVAGAAGSSGHDLKPLIRGEVESLRPHVCSHYQVGDSIEWSLRTLEWAYLLPVKLPEGDAPREPQLYHKPADRWDVNDVRQHHHEVVETLESTLRSHMATRGAG